MALVRPVKKQLNINLKLLLLVVVYLFFHIINSFFVPKRIVADKLHTSLRQGTLCIIQLQKSAKTAVSETRLSFTKLIQKASKYFIVLVFFAFSAPFISYFYTTKNRLLTDPPSLRLCILRI